MLPCQFSKEKKLPIANHHNLLRSRLCAIRSFFFAALDSESIAWSPDLRQIEGQQTVGSENGERETSPFSFRVLCKTRFPTASTQMEEYALFVVGIVQMLVSTIDRSDLHRPF